MNKKYTIVHWPDNLKLNDHPRFEECLLIDDENGVELFGEHAYYVPTDLADELQSIKAVYLIATAR